MVRRPRSSRASRGRAWERAKPRARSKPRRSGAVQRSGSKKKPSGGEIEQGPRLRSRSTFASDDEWAAYFSAHAKAGTVLVNIETKQTGTFVKMLRNKIFTICYDSEGSKSTRYCKMDAVDFRDGDASGGVRAANPGIKGRRASASTPKKPSAKSRRAKGPMRCVCCGSERLPSEFTQCLQCKKPLLKVCVYKKYGTCKSCHNLASNTIVVEVVNGKRVYKVPENGVDLKNDLKSPATRKRTRTRAATTPRKTAGKKKRSRQSKSQRRKASSAAESGRKRQRASSPTTPSLSELNDDCESADAPTTPPPAAARRASKRRRRAPALADTSDHDDSNDCGESEVSESEAGEQSEDDKQCAVSTDDIWDERPGDARHLASGRKGMYLVNSMSGDPCGVDCLHWRGESQPKKGCIGMVPNGFAQAYPGETRARVESRAAAYRRAVDRVRTVAAEAQHQHQGRLFERVHQWVLSRDRHAANDEDAPEHRELPVALVVAGFNTADHRESFKRLGTFIATGGADKPVTTPAALSECLTGEATGAFVARLSPATAPTPRAALVNLAEQLLKQNIDADKGRRSIRARGALRRMYLCEAKHLKTREERERPMQALRQWFSNLDEKRQYVWRDGKRAQRRKIVIVFEELEGFSDETLNYLIYSLTLHVGALPLVAVLASAAGAPRFSPANQRRLWIERFSLPSPVAVFGSIFERLFVDNECAVHLPSETMQFLHQDFVERTASISGFSLSLSAILLSHYDKQGLSQLFAREDDDDDDASVDADSLDLCPADIKYLKSLQSVRKALSMSPRDKTPLEQRVVDWIAGLRLHRQRLPTAFGFIWEAARALLPDLSLDSETGASMRRRLYYQSQRCEVGKVAELSPLFKTVMGLTERDLGAALERWATYMEKNGEGLMGEAPRLSGDIQRMIGALEAAESSVRSRRRAGSSRSAGDTSETPRRRIRNPKKRRQAILSVAVSTQKTRKVVNAMAEKFLREFCTEFLTPMKRFPLHELLLFEPTANLSRVNTRRDLARDANTRGFGLRTQTLDYRPRLAIHSALTRPETYLGGRGSENDGKAPAARARGGLRAEMDDICVGFGVLGEMGKSVNLFDWYQAFAAIHGKRFSPKELQARFTRCSNELQLLGLIRPSVRKIDHVQQLSAYKPRL